MVVSRVALIDLQQQLQYEGVHVEFEVLLLENRQELAYFAEVVQLGRLLSELDDVFLPQCLALFVLVELT